MSPLRRKDMDRAHCEKCGAGAPAEVPDHAHVHALPLFLHGRCHPKAGSRVSYLDGVLTIACRECKKLVAEVEVAS